MKTKGNAEWLPSLFSPYTEKEETQYPRFQEYFRTHRPPTLAVWGENDPYFLPAGAQSYRRDNPSAQVHLLPTGHFALETHAVEIAGLIRAFLAPVLGSA